jgi:putative transposase
MKTVLHPWQMLLLILAGWINQQQQHAIEYLISENRILREKIGKKRLLLTDDQRRRLAVKGKVLRRKALARICGILTPDTILRWHRELIAKKWDYSKCRKNVGRPRIEKEVAELVVQMAKENPSWGHNKIPGALANLGYGISDTAIGNILKEHGIEPAPERKKPTTWKAFLEAHWDVLAAIDFTTIEVGQRAGSKLFRGVFRTYDTRWGEILAESRIRIYDPFSYGAEPSGARKSDHSAGYRSGQSTGRDRLS